ncbi:MAG TPA: hypothetical protein VEI52_03145 [Terriglobales bacterium]|nr:hypothetical protein [Terriglobales bacterium]
MEQDLAVVPSRVDLSKQGEDFLNLLPYVWVRDRGIAKVRRSGTIRPQ